MTNSTWLALIGALGIGGILREVIVYFRDRKKDNTTVNIANVTELQAKLLYLESILKTVKQHNDGLQEDVTEAEARAQRYRMRVRELEDELDQVRRHAIEIQQRCDRLESRVRQLSDGRFDQ